MSKTDIPTNAPLLATITYIWSSSFNSFIFKSGIKTITLYDLVILLDLKPYEEEINITFIINITSFNSIIIKSTDCGLFIKSYCHRKDKVIQAECAAFLLTWINKFISYNQTKKIFKSYLGTVVALVIGIEMALRPFALNHILKKKDLKTMENKKLNATMRDPIWMVQILLVTYYTFIFY